MQPSRFVFVCFAKINVFSYFEMYACANNFQSSQIRNVFVARNSFLFNYFLTNAISIKHFSISYKILNYLFL